VKFLTAHLPSRYVWRARNLCAELWGAVVAALIAAIIALGALTVGAHSLFAKTAKQQTNSDAPDSAVNKVAAIKSFRIVQEKEGQAVEILSTKPVIPSIQPLNNPDRLVIDLPNARLDTQQKRISVEADQISTLRANQFQENPPVTRVVVDLLAPRTYTWNASGNRLVIHLGKNPQQARNSPFEPNPAVSVPALTSGPQPVLTAVRAAGPLALVGKDFQSGSLIAAGPDTAVLGLSSGGEIYVCPGTTLSVTPSKNRHNIMLSMNTGGLEAHFALDSSSDSVMTPDFRVLLAGPGEFHYAISADNEGTTCVRTLPGNTAGVFVSELLGDRTYQVKAKEQVVFRFGQLDRVDTAIPPECGCPVPRDTPLRATNNLPTQDESASDVPRKIQSQDAAADTQPPADARAEKPPVTGLPETSPARNKPDMTSEIQVEVEAPLVFHATGPPPAPVEDVRALPLEARSITPPGLSAAPPATNATTTKPKSSGAENHQPAPSRGFFRKIGGFFASLFH
jgi:hypothetical protein